jgi:hypothetical protein
MTKSEIAAAGKKPAFVVKDPSGLNALRERFERSQRGAKTERVYMNCMGRRILVKVTPAHADYLRKDKRKLSALKSRRRARALKLIGRGDIVASIEAVRKCSMLVGSEARLLTIVGLLERAPAEVVWPVFFSEWSHCDDTWQHMQRLLTLLRRNAPGLSYFDDDQRALFDALPKDITIYRGCSLERVFGLSWTLFPNVAVRFAQGHRFIPVPQPTIASARVRRDDVFAVIVDRKEDEIIVDPKKLWNVRTQSAHAGK